LVGVFLDPRRTFESIDRKPDYLVPLLLVIVVGTLFTIITWPIIESTLMQAQIEQLEEQGMTQEQIDQAMSVGKMFGFIGPAISIILGSLVVSLILLFAGNVMMGGSSKFKKVFSVYCYSGVISILAYVIKLPLALNKNSLEVYISPAALFPASAQDTILFKVAAVFDVFVIWQLIVVTVGMSVIFKTSFQKAITVVGTLYIIYAAATIAFGGGPAYNG